MESRRRLVALATLLAVAWTALWPVVSVAHALAMAEDIPLCHQAGMQVAPDAMPQPAEGPSSDGKVHCPLCIMAFYAAHAPQLEAPPFQFSVVIAVPDARATLFVVRFVSPLPPSRAPPAPLPA